MNVNVTFGQGESDFPVKIGATDNGMDVDFGNTQLIKGDKGDDGISPTVDITPIDGGHRISITDADGTETADVLDGKDGRNGKDGADGYTPVKGVDYFDGDPGADGISPTVAVQDITGGHRVTITDKDGEKTFDVMDGKDGKDGAGGSGGAAVQSDWSVNDESDPAYVKNRTHWLERPYEPIVWDGSTEGRDSVDLSLTQGLPAGSFVCYKISDHVLMPDALQSSTAYTTINGRTEKMTGLTTDIIVEGAVWTSGYATRWQNGNTTEDFAGGVILFSTIAGDFSDSLGVVIPSTGTYAVQTYSYGTDKHLVEISADTYHTIDKRYLPDSFATVEYVDNAITGAIGGSY